MGEARELKLALLFCAALGLLYFPYALLADPGGGHPFGYGLGLLGALLMLATEILYSLRKRTRLLRWAGPVRYWLSAHIVTGLVGPFLVLMHTAFEFRGLAGFATGLMALVVASGFFGRYLYTAIPRSLAGVEISAADLAAALRANQAALAHLARAHSPAVQTWVAAESQRAITARPDWALVLLLGWERWAYRRGLRRRVHRAERAERTRLADVERLLLEGFTRERQLRSLSAARRLFSLWHTIHVPLGVALFASIAIHAAATLYFGAGPWP